MSKKVDNWYYYSGVVHIHTNASDGTKNIDEIISIGREVGLDFMMFADHMTLVHRENGYEGIYGNMLVVIGYEHNDANDKNHYLVFGSPKVYPADMSVKAYVAAVADDKAVGIIAHPDEIRSRMDKYPPYPWTEWKVNGFQGMELWNQMSEWMEKLTPWNHFAMALSPRKSMVGPTSRLLKIWDDLNRVGRCAGLASVDAHAFRIKLGPFKFRIFPYKVHFKALRTHIILPEPLSGEFEKAKKQLYDAIRDNRLFFSNMRWGAADDFEFFAVNSTGKVISGGTLNLDENTRLLVKLPSRAILKIIADGQKLLETVTEKLDYTVTRKGVYRVEVWKKKRGWIFSNHIRIGV